MGVVMPDGDDSILWKTPQLTSREKAVIRGFRYYHYRGKIRYSQARPTQIRLPRETTRLDCSGLVAACFDFAGVLPRIDWRYTNTWLQIKLGRRVTTVEAARPGDVVFYGPSSTNPTHEAMFLGTLAELRKLVKVPQEVQTRMGRAVCVLTMGSYPMDIRPIDYRGDRIQIRDIIGKDV